MARPPAHPLPPVDSAGNTVVMGVRVRIVGIPDSLIHDLPLDEAVALKALEGTERQVVDIDAYGYVWFGCSDGSPWFCVRPSDTLVLAAAGELSNNSFGPNPPRGAV